MREQINKTLHHLTFQQLQVYTYLSQVRSSGILIRKKKKDFLHYDVQ